MKMKQLSRMIGLVIWLATVQTSLGFYNPSTGRWLSRDPVGEQGGRNLYTIVENDAVRNVDALGLMLTRPPSDVWFQSFQIQKPLPAGVNGVTTVDYMISIDDVSVTDCGSCCKLRTGSFKMRIRTDYAQSIGMNTMFHEGAHAAADYLLGDTMLPRAVSCLKSRCADLHGQVTPKDCRKKLEAEARAIESTLEGLADGLLQTMHHLYIGTTGHSTAGENAFQSWLEAWLPAWQDDIAKSGDCKFW